MAVHSIFKFFSRSLGVQFNIVLPDLFGLFLSSQFYVLNHSTDGLAYRTIRLSKSILAGLFMLSGIAALVYQVVWQNFYLPFLDKHRISNANRFDFYVWLGSGAFAGGWLSEKFAKKLPELFYGLKWPLPYLVL